MTLSVDGELCMRNVPYPNTFDNMKHVMKMRFGDAHDKRYLLMCVIHGRFVAVICTTIYDKLRQDCLSNLVDF